MTTGHTSGQWNTAGTITGLEFSFVTGNISSGTVKIFGIVNWLLRRDVDPLTPANDNTPMGLNAVA